MSLTEANNFEIGWSEYFSGISLQQYQQNVGNGSYPDEEQIIHSLQ